MLHGVSLLQVEAMPTCGCAKSASSKPTARSMARAGACFTPSTTSLEWRRESGAAALVFFALTLAKADSSMGGSSAGLDYLALSQRHDEHAGQSHHCAEDHARRQVLVEQRDGEQDAEDGESTVSGDTLVTG